MTDRYELTAADRFLFFLWLQKNWWLDAWMLWSPADWRRHELVKKYLKEKQA